MIARRVKSVTTVVILLVVTTVFLPLLASLAALVGLVRRARFIELRLLLFGWIYLLGEFLGVAGAGLILLVSRPGSTRFVDLNYRLQFWWASFLFRWVCRLLDLAFTVEGDDEVEPGPILIFMRHTSIVDNLLPLMLVSKPHDMRIRYVLKYELLSDPALDIVGNRLPNMFVDRDGGGEAQLDQLRDLAQGLASNEGVIIYPEGTRFTPAKQKKVLDKLAGTEFHERALALRSVLPPRINGPLALLEGAPDADVIFCAHRGLEGFATVGDILSGKLVGEQISVTFRRVARSAIPEGRSQRTDWLYEEWAEVDRTVSG